MIGARRMGFKVDSNGEFLVDNPLSLMTSRPKTVHLGH